MSLWRFARYVTRTAIVFAITLVLVSGLSSLARPQAAQAQSCTGGGYSLGCQGYSGCSSSFGGSSSYGQGYGQGCSSYGSNGCGGLFNSTPCTGAGFNGAACGQSLFQSGASCGGANSCVGRTLQLGQSCSNGVITCSPPSSGPPVPCGSGPTSYCPQNAPPTACAGNNCLPNVSSSLCPTGYQQPTAHPALAVAGNTPVTCPGGGWATSLAGCSAGLPQSTTCSADSGQASVGSTCASPVALSGGGAGANLTSATTGFTVTYASGWNIVAAPAGTAFSGANGSLYTIQAGDTNYETVTAGSPLKAGAGYWLNIPGGAQATLPTASPLPVVVQLPPGQWVMVGNPGTTTATVSGADSVLIYDPGSGNYNQTTQLQPGQGAWTVSYSGGQASISNAPLGQTELVSDGS